jgi:DNA-binding beta-propeller fold protein YncE
MYVGVALALFTAVLLLVRTASPARAERPRLGWHYVVDTKKGGVEAQILLVDPTAGAVVRTYKTGMNPDIAVAPDGKRLYVASTSTDGNTNKEQLDVVDTATGTVIQTADNSNRATYNVLPPSSAMALSNDGRWLYVMKYETQTIGPEHALYWVETFDTQTGKFLPEKANLSACGWGQISVSPRGQGLQVVCEDTKEVWLLKITGTGAAAGSPVGLNSAKDAARARAAVKAGKLDRVAGGFTQGDRNIAVMRDGRILEVDSTTNGVKEIAGAKVQSGQWVHTVIGAPEPGKVFVSFSLPSAGSQGRWTAGEIAEVNMADSSEVVRVKTSLPFDYLFLSKDGRRLYAVGAMGATLTILDATTLKEVKTLRGLGISPSLVVEAP